MARKQTLSGASLIPNQDDRMAAIYREYERLSLARRLAAALPQVP